MVWYPDSLQLWYLYSSVHIPPSITTFEFHCTSCMRMWPLQFLTLPLSVSPQWGSSIGTPGCADSNQRHIDLPFPLPVETRRVVPEMDRLWDGAKAHQPLLHACVQQIFIDSMTAFWRNHRWFLCPVCLAANVCWADGMSPMCLAVLSRPRRRYESRVST